MSQDIDHQSKLRAYDLYDSGKIHSLEVGTAKASRSLYIQLTACVATPHNPTCELRGTSKPTRRGYAVRTHAVA